MRVFLFLLSSYFVLGADGCGVNYKTQTTSGANSAIENFDPDGSIVVTATDQADVNANQGSDTTDTNNEEIGGIPLNPSTASGFTTDPCKSSTGQPVSGKTCASRSIDLSDK